MSHFESLHNLFDGEEARIHSVDKLSTYTLPQLIDALHSILSIYQPAQIRTQATASSETFPDHSDHLAVSQIVQMAHERYEHDTQASIPLARYIGYPVRDMPPNVTDNELAAKQDAFFAYARFDGAVCYSMRDCSNTPTYWQYLQRQYTEQ